MYHYFDDVRTPQGPVLAGFYVRLVDSTTGETASLYADESETPIITSSGIADAALVDGDGNVDLYVAAGTYHLDYYAPDGVTFVKRVRNIPMTQNIFDGASVVAATTAGFGYAVGNGGDVAQSTSKSTTVEFSKLCGFITMTDDALAAGTSVSFQFDNPNVSPTDHVMVWTAAALSGVGNYIVVSEGTDPKFITLRNVSSGSLAEAVTIGFAIFKSVES